MPYRLKPMENIFIRQIPVKWISKCILPVKVYVYAYAHTHKPVFILS